MRNEVYRDADELTLPVPEGTKSGDAVIVGDLPGVAATDRDADGNATVWMRGAYDLSVTGAVTQIGAPIYIPAAGGNLSVTADGNKLFGHALATKTAAAAVITVKLAKV